MGRTSIILSHIYIFIPRAVQCVCLTDDIMADHRVKALTYRVENIPPGTSKEELLERYFYREDRDDIKVKSLCPSCDSVDPDEDDWTATIFFRPRDPDRGELRLANDDTLTISKDFFGFTPLYVPPKEKGPVAAE